MSDNNQRCGLGAPRLRTTPHPACLPACLQEAGVAARLKLYRGKTHTKPIVEDPSEWRC